MKCTTLQPHPILGPILEHILEHHAITTVEMWNDKTNNNFNNVKILNAIFVVCRVVKVLTKVHVLYEVLLHFT
jgi:hypothetical protein